MIYIDAKTIEVRIPPEWLEKARKAQEELCMLGCQEERRQYIDNKASLWRELKDVLFEASHKKCWYCEAKEDRSDYHVDHFRPKLRVRDENGQEVECEGYWWLAFDWHNFRISCSYCNARHRGEDGRSHGKWDRFPVKDEVHRAKDPSNNVDDEVPLLLDPLTPGDPEHLLFMDDGQAYPAVPKGTFPCQRAELSIDALFLNDVRVTESRKDLWIRCHGLLARGDKAFKDYMNGSQAGMTTWKSVVKEILDLTSPQAEYSATARAFFKSRTEDWIRAVI